jgi:peptidyl-Asp metalloendopeptidase
MNTRYRAKLTTSPLPGLAALLTTETALAADPLSIHPAWLWVFNLPDWALGAVPVLLGMALAWLGSLAYRRLRPTHSRSKHRLDYAAALAGGLAGLLITPLVAGPWQNYVADQIIELPPTAAGQPGVDLLIPAAPEIAAAIPPRPPSALAAHAGRDRRTGIDFTALNQDRLYLNLFEDTDLVAVRLQIEDNGRGSFVWIGRIEGFDDSEVILAVRGPALMGTIKWDGRVFEILYVNDDTHAVREIDLSTLPPEDPPGAMDESSEDGALELEPLDTAGTAAAAATGQIIDVLVVYTPNARQNAGGDAGMQTRILNAVTAVNQAYLNSGIDIRLNLVHTALTDYVETNALSTSRARLLDTTDGYMDEVHILRNQYGADLVVLVSTDTDACSVSAVMNRLSTGFAASALAVVRDGCLSTGSLAHAVGHMQGNAHNPESSAVAGVHPDAYGYRVCGKFRDIMSYACNNEPRISYFSNPDITYDGLATGLPGSNDTARSMNATAATVANFRSSLTVTMIPNPPGNLTATASVATDSVNLTWTDNAINESGYRVQSSLDQTDWTEIAVLGPNMTRFSDTRLSRGRTYHYRVLAFNNIGHSAFSNLASATPR